MLLLSFCGAAIGYGLAALGVGAGSITLLLLSRLPVGFAKQTVTATRAVVSDLTPPDATRSEALAKLFAGCSLGYAVGPYLGGLLAEGIGSSSPLPALICALVFVALVPIVATLLPETARIVPPRAETATAVAEIAATAAKGKRGTRAKLGASAKPPNAALGGSESLLLLGCTCPEGALVLFSSTSLALLAQGLGWPASRLGLYNSAWGVASGSLSLTLWPHLLKSGLVSDTTALHCGTASLGLASALIAWRGSATMLWAVLPLGVVAVGMIRTLPGALVTKAAPSSHRGVALGRLDAAGSICRVALPTIAGALSDRHGVWAVFAAQAALCAAGVVIIEVWRRHAAPGN